MNLLVLCFFSPFLVSFWDNVDILFKSELGTRGFCEPDSEKLNLRTSLLGGFNTEASGSGGGALVESFGGAGQALLTWWDLWISVQNCS